MLLAVNVGNTNTVLGVFRGTELEHQWRMSTETERTAELFASLAGAHSLDRLLLVGGPTLGRGQRCFGRFGGHDYHAVAIGHDDIALAHRHPAAHDRLGHRSGRLLLAPGHIHPPRPDGEAPALDPLEIAATAVEHQRGNPSGQGCDRKDFAPIATEVAAGIDHQYVALAGKRHRAMNREVVAGMARCRKGAPDGAWRGPDWLDRRIDGAAQPADRFHCARFFTPRFR